MKITRQEAHYIALTLQQQANKHRELIGEASVLLPALEKAAKALKRGEALEVER